MVVQKVEGLAAVPIDLNGNGTIDPAERFYQTRDDLTKAIAERNGGVM